MEEFVETFYSFDLAGDSVVDNGDEGEINFDTNDIEENLNENDSNKNDSNENDLNDEIESENNEKDGETVWLDDSISTENKELPINIIKNYLKTSNKKLLSNITWENFRRGKVTKYFPSDKYFSPTSFPR